MRSRINTEKLKREREKEREIIIEIFILRD